MNEARATYLLARSVLGLNPGVGHPTAPWAKRRLVRLNRFPSEVTTETGLPGYEEQVTTYLMRGHGADPISP